MSTPPNQPPYNNTAPRNSTALPNITVQQLEYLVAAVDHDTHAEAAAAIGVSASALSQGLTELGRKLGMELFGRDGRSMVLRGDASVVLDHARLVLAQTADLARYATNVSSGRAGRVRIGMIDVAAIHHFAPVLHDIRSNLPELALHLTVAPSSSLLDQVSAGALDLVVAVRPEAGRADLDVVDLVDEPLHVYVASAPVGQFTVVPDRGNPASWGPWVGFPPNSRTRRVIAAALRGLGATYEVVAESHQPEVLKEMTALGIGWVVLPPVQAEAEPRRLRRVSNEPLTFRTLAAVRRASAPPSPSITMVLDRLVTATRQNR